MVVGVTNEEKVKKASFLPHSPRRPLADPTEGNEISPRGFPCASKTRIRGRTFSRYRTKSLPPTVETPWMEALAAGTTAFHLSRPGSSDPRRGRGRWVPASWFGDTACRGRCWER